MVNNMTPAELGYVAGIVDGEGCISMQTSQAKAARPRLHVANTNFDLLKYLHDTVGVGSIVDHGNDGLGWKPSWAWMVANDSLADVLRAILPYLGIKKQQAEEVVKLDDLEISLGWAYKGGTKLPVQILEARLELGRFLGALNRRGLRIG